MSDPYFANVELLLLGDGANGSSTIVDSSSVGRTITVNGNAQNSTAEQKVGPGSLKFDGTGDYLTCPQNGGTSPTGMLFTWPICVDFWIKTTSTGRFDVIGAGASGVTPWRISINDGASGRVRWIYQDSFVPATYNASINDGSWHHVAVLLADEGALKPVRLFTDGVHRSSGNFGAAAGGGVGSSVGIGACQYDVSNSDGDGDVYVDCLRVTTAIRWPGTTSFTPPSTLADYITVGGIAPLVYSYRRRRVA